MRAMVVGPLASSSTYDVAQGWSYGLQQAGCQTAYFDLYHRWVYYSSAKVMDDDGNVARQMDPDEAKRAVTLGLLAELYRYQPDVVFVIHGPHVLPELIAEIRVPVVIIGTESPYEDEAQALWFTRCEPDMVLINDPTNLGVFQSTIPQSYYVPHAYRPELHQPTGDRIYCDVSFVGTGFASRVALLREVDWTGIHLLLAGNFGVMLPDDDPLQRYVHNDGLSIPNTETAAIYRGSQIGLNAYRTGATGELASTDQGWAIGPREVELAACGAFFLREPRPESDELFPFLPSFESGAELDWLIHEWLPRHTERRELGKRAREAVADRTFANHARRALARLGL